MNKSDSHNLTINLDDNLNLLKEKLNHTSDFMMRKIKIVGNHSHNGAILFIDGITNTDYIQEYILNPLLDINKFTEPKQDSYMEDIAFHHIRSTIVEIETSVEQCVQAIIQGKTIVLLNGFKKAILADTTDWKQRSIEQSSSQRSILGPMNGFNEELKVNINLLRNIIQTPDFCVETIKVGTYTQKDVALIYLQGIVDQKALAETKKRIQSLNIRYVQEAKVIEDAIEGGKVLYPLSMNSERPDVVAANLYEGKIAILVNGTPHALIVPGLFFQYIQSPDDYYLKYGRFTSRMITLFSYLMTILLPGIYLAFERFHEDLFPKKFAIKLFSETETLPPAILEIMLLLLVMQMVISASLRVPKDVVITVSLVGTLILSQTAVEAKLIHPISILVAGVSMLAGFLNVKGLASVTSPLRITYIFIGNFLGFTGLIVGFILNIIYMARLNSVGVPYLSPLFPFNLKEFKDVFIRGNNKDLINSKHTYPHVDKMNK